MVVPKPLHLATNLQELQNKGKIGDVGKLKVYQLCQNGQKVLKEAIMKQYLGDEEHAYFLYFKFVEFIQKVREHPVFLDNSKYFMNLYNIPKNLKAAEDALEALSNSLECRYEVQRKEESLKIFDDKFSKFKIEERTRCKSFCRGVRTSIPRTCCKVSSRDPKILAVVTNISS